MKIFGPLVQHQDLNHVVLKGEDDKTEHVTRTCLQDSPFPPSTVNFVSVHLVTDAWDIVLQGGVPKDHPAAVGEEGPEEKHVDIGRTRQDMNLARQIVSFLPPFVPSSSTRVTNEQCIKDSERYLQELDDLALWALLMHDSSAKLPPGLLNGNVNQYGDLDQCLNVRSPRKGGVIKGRYCLTTMSFHLSDPDHPLLSHVRELLLSHGMLRSELDDPGHRVPRFSAVHWALCVPASCNSSDVQLALADTLQKHAEGTGITFKVRVAAGMCQTKDDKLHLPLSTIIVSLVFVVVTAFAAFATACDLNWSSAEQKLSTWRKLVQAFSLRKNAVALFSLSRSTDDIESVHGVRAINALLLLVAHKCMAFFFNPYTNRTVMTEDLGRSWTSFTRGACLYTDVFIMLSGMLTSYSFYKQLERKKRLDVPWEYLSRLMRLVPNLVALILFCTFILPWTGTGPLWNQVVQHHSDICKNTWWHNFLFIHNYFGFESMCLTHTHHLGIDTQLFFLSPLFVYAAWRWPRIGFSVLAGVASVSTALRYGVTYSKRLSYFVIYGSSTKQLFQSADLSYTLPAHRATAYVIGIALGFGLRYCGRDYRLKKMHFTLGWTTAVVCFYMAIISPAHMASRYYVYNPTEAANFAAFAPIFCCLFLAWIIFMSYIGHGGLLGRVLSWRGFLVTTRLSYAFYLVQFPIFFYGVGKNRVTQSYSVLLLIDVPEMMVIIAASILLTLLFDLPFQNIRKIMQELKAVE
ncbi:O-acyltransferase like protein-like isoform X2 [Zootermopsis nevadensis]|uniref:O-acyltransferase like protein-like isoform X2 n=1 Tax=Zootermopsis nevadensis TaxID=136037 RepID=UPI000B8EDCE8|nr:O-acyltransferase like protein-like isoform X2 [Zootermopsis nevadensis]